MSVSIIWFQFLSSKKRAHLPDELRFFVILTVNDSPDRRDKERKRELITLHQEIHKKDDERFPTHHSYRRVFFVTLFVSSKISGVLASLAHL